MAEQQKAIGIIALFEFGLHIYYTPLATDNLSVDTVSLEELKQENSNSRSAAIGIVNDGNVIDDAAVELELTNTVTGEEIKMDPINISMLPGAKQTVTFALPPALKGSYLGVAIIKMAG